MDTEASVRLAAKWLVVIWHPWVLAASQAGPFFHFGNGRAAATFPLIVLAAGVLVFIGYFFDDRVRGWIAMLIWNGLGAYNYYGTRLRVLCAVFAAAFVLTALSSPFIHRHRGP